MNGWLVAGDVNAAALASPEARALLQRPARIIAAPEASPAGWDGGEGLAVLRAGLLPPEPRAMLALILGEADCGYHVWREAERTGLHPYALLEDSIDGYFALVDALLAGGYPGLVLLGAPPPAIEAGVGRPGGRQPLNVSLQRRTQMVLDYNMRLSAGAKTRDLRFVDLAITLIDPARGVAAEALRMADPADPRLNPGRLGETWAGALNAIAPLV